MYLLLSLHLYIYICTYLHMYIYIYVYTHVHIYIYLYARMYAHIYTYTHTYLKMHAVKMHQEKFEHVAADVSGVFWGCRCLLSSTRIRCEIRHGPTIVTNLQAHMEVERRPFQTTILYIGPSRSFHVNLESIVSAVSSPLVLSLSFGLGY